MHKTLLYAVLSIGFAGAASMAYSQAGDASQPCGGDLGPEAREACLARQGAVKGETVQEMTQVQEREKVSTGAAAGQGQEYEHGSRKGTGGSSHREGKSDPAGSKNKPQKQGH